MIGSEGDLERLYSIRWYCFEKYTQKKTGKCLHQNRLGVVEVLISTVETLSSALSDFCDFIFLNINKSYDSQSDYRAIAEFYTTAVPIFL